MRFKHQKLTCTVGVYDWHHITGCLLFILILFIFLYFSYLSLKPVRKKKKRCSAVEIWQRETWRFESVWVSLHPFSDKQRRGFGFFLSIKLEQIPVKVTPSRFCCCCWTFAGWIFQAERHGIYGVGHEKIDKHCENGSLELNSVRYFLFFFWDLKENVLDRQWQTMYLVRNHAAYRLLIYLSLVKKFDECFAESMLWGFTKKSDYIFITISQCFFFACLSLSLSQSFTIRLLFILNLRNWHIHKKSFFIIAILT